MRIAMNFPAPRSMAGPVAGEAEARQNISDGAACPPNVPQRDLACGDIDAVVGHNIDGLP
jgi:hypothetical protein